MNMFQLIKLVAVGAAAMTLSACMGPAYRHAAHNIADTHAELANAEINADTIKPPVVVDPGFYIDTHHASLNHPPEWMTRMITVRASRLPLDRLMSRLLRNGQVSVAYENSANPGAPVSINYHGTIQGALDMIAHQTNYSYNFTGNTVSWSAFQTHVFNISFMPGSSDYMVGQGQNIGHSVSNVFHGSSPSGLADDQQFSSLVGSVSVWHDIHDTLDQLKSADGKVIISEATTSVTVHDYPDNVRAMGRYIKQMNHMLSQQVLIKVQVLDVALNRQFASGIDWNVVAHIVSDNSLTNIRFKGSLFDKVSPFNFAGGEAVPGLILSRGSHPSSETLIHALEQQGDVSTITQPRVVTLNNQPAAIRITQNTGYLKSISITSAANVGTTASITPGEVTDGFTLYLLPKIQGSKVFMQISSKLSNLVGIEKVSTGNIFAPSDNHKTHDDQKDNNNNDDGAQETIQVPTTTEKSFNQRSVIPTGETLVVAGFKRLRDQTDHASQFHLTALGGTGAKTNNIETVILITPVIMREGGE